IFQGLSVAPDGHHILVTRTHRPFSYLFPDAAFPRDVEVWDAKGKVVLQSRQPAARGSGADRWRDDWSETDSLVTYSTDHACLGQSGRRRRSEKEGFTARQRCRDQSAIH